MLQMQYRLTCILKVQLLLSTLRLPHSSPPFNLVYLVCLLIHALFTSAYRLCTRRGLASVITQGDRLAANPRDSRTPNGILKFCLEDPEGMDSNVLDFLQSGNKHEFYRWCAARATETSPWVASREV